MTPKWVHVHFLKRSLHILECRAQRAEPQALAEARTASRSPSDTALWKAKKYILFDLRFGTSGNCPGTLFTAYKSCLPHGKGNIFLKQKLLTIPIFKALFSDPPSSHTLWSRNQGNVSTWFHGTVSSDSRLMNEIGAAHLK